MSSNYPPGSGSSNTNNTFVVRRDIRANNATGALSPVDTGRVYPGTFDFEQMLIALHELFEHDRQLASQSDATRCGICYLHFSVSELHYREEGFYACLNCERALGKQSLPMLRKQQKL